MAKKFTSRDKVVNKMTKDGLEELNVTKGTKENISNRKDIYYRLFSFSSSMYV